MLVDTATLLEIFDAALEADYTRVRRAGNRVARALAESGDAAGAKALQAALKQRAIPLQASGYSESLPRDAGSRLPLVEEGQWPTTPAFLNEQSGKTVARFLEDAANSALLAREGVATRLGLLIHGPPGSGKSLLAGHIAARLQRPFYIVRLDSIISSRLGETAKNIRGVFEFIPQRKAVLFLDEMDAIARLRDDRQELGELKRVVNTVLQGLDSLADDVVVVGATNHAHLLDPAIWRRFPYKLTLDMPEADVRREMWARFLYADAAAPDPEVTLLSRLSDGLSGADIENIALGARRRAILDGAQLALAQVLNAVTLSRPGAPELVHDGDLSAEEKKRLAARLRDRGEMTVTDIAKLLGVSRQMTHRYLGNQEPTDAC